MVGTSKILTVSYGTFSCTLEGFDDSFNTMKAIAEYFRGLAADDRYFGAEPPTPDAVMLAKIAEREIARRVDARMEDDGIVLRPAALANHGAAEETQSDVDEAAAAAEAKAAAKAVRKAAKAAAKAERKAAKARQEAEEKANADARAEAADAGEEADEAVDADVHEAAVVTEDSADTTNDTTPSVEAEPALDEDTFDPSALLSSVSAATAAATEGDPDQNVEETRSDALSSVLAADDPAPPPIQPHPDADSVAAKLARIRSVVGEPDADPTNDATEAFLPDAGTPDVADVEETSEDLVSEFEAHEAELADEAETKDVEDDAEDMVANETADEDSDEEASDKVDMISRIAARHADDTATAQQDDAAVEDEGTAEPEPRARIVHMKRADLNAVADDQQEAPEAETGPDFGLLDGADELEDYLEDSDFADDMHSLSGDAEIADALHDTIADETGTDHDDETVSDENDADDATQVGETPEAADDADAIAARSFLAEDPEIEDEALDRLMSETDAQMQEPEGSRRRDAIAQLKAAVAAKEAARQAGEDDDDGQDVENAFRNDLSEAVRPEGVAPRPRPVVRSETRTERPRPAPLKLVAAQRVDLPSAEPRDGPVMPRRVAARPASAQPEAAGSFADFAEKTGAKNLPDLLEAAAAYTSFVEGAEEFSRPQLLRRVRAVADDDFNREDGLRSFAELLRVGRITKVRNGRFQIAEDTRFHPERIAS